MVSRRQQLVHVFRRFFLQVLEDTYGIGLGEALPDEQEERAVLRIGGARGQLGEAGAQGEAFGDEVPGELVSRCGRILLRSL